MVAGLTASRRRRASSSTQIRSCRSSAGSRIGISGFSRFEHSRSDASPKRDQRRAVVLAVRPPAPRPVRRDRSLAPAQHPDRVLPVISGDRHQFVQNPALLGPRRRAIPLSDRRHHLAPRRHAEPPRHPPPRTTVRPGSIPAEATSLSGNKIDEAMRPLATRRTGPWVGVRSAEGLSR